MIKGVIFVEPGRCLACKSCELACAVEHSNSQDLIKAIEEIPKPLSRLNIEVLNQISIPLLCAQCKFAPCVVVCPSNAMKKTKPTDIIIIDEKLCIGCKSCVFVCPYGIPQAKRDGKIIIKCDLCIERLKTGKLPKCVESCPTSALQYKEVENIDKKFFSMV